jgi:hypothetical protein
MTFKPLYCSDRWKGLLAVLGLALLDVLLLRVVTSRPVDGASYILGLLVLASVPVMVYLLYRTVGAFTLEYWVDRDAVTVVWGPSRQVVPMAEIQRVQRGATPPADVHARPRPWHWPCPDCRQVLNPQLGVVRMYATRSLVEQVVLVTPGANFGISPADPQGFIEALQERYRLGVARPLRAEIQRPPLWTWELWRDWRALALIGAGLLGVLAMFGALCFRFPVLSSDLPLHFDVNGLPDRIAPKAGLFALPFIGLLLWAVNLVAGILVYRRGQRQGAYILWAGALAVQVILGLALFNLMRW